MEINRRHYFRSGLRTPLCNNGLISSFSLLSRKAQQQKHFQLASYEDGFVAGHDTTLRMHG
jgi:hypothetical protein